MRVLAVSAAGVALAAVAAVAARAALSPAQQHAACSPGPHRTKVSGHNAIKFCGPAKVTVHLGAKTLRYSSGLCNRSSAAFTVNIGTAVPGFSGPRPDYFGLAAQKPRAGTQKNPAIVINTGGKGYAVWRATVTLAPGLKRGTFKGKLLLKTTPVSGSFTC